MATASYCRFDSTLRRWYGGPLGSYIDDFTALLEKEGYRPASIRGALQIVAAFSRWLYGRYLEASDVDAYQVQQFLRYRRRTVTVQPGQRAALMKLTGLLRNMGIMRAATTPVILNVQERIEKDFGEYVVRYRGLSVSTLRNYLPFVSRFLREQFDDGPIRLEILGARDVTRFVQRHAGERSHSHAQMLVKALRAFFRHLHRQGAIKADLAAAVPKVAQWSNAALPSCLRPEEVGQVLRCCDRQMPEGRRDYAIVLLLAHLGLRAGEVAALTLDQIDWRESRLRVRGKGGEWAQLPFPEEVGEALADYLVAARPSGRDRHVFIRTRAPRRGYSSSTISSFATRALVRAGIDTVCTGAHIFRHSLATEMLRQGASLTEIGQLLRHKHPDTTRIYAKVDLPALRDLALPWPGGAQ
jgi:site-specific recombinase XerD